MSTGYLPALTRTVPAGAWVVDRAGGRTFSRTGLVIFLLHRPGATIRR
ncbi:hypothetical protein ABZ894_04275 [Nocardia beijingensis]